MFKKLKDKLAEEVKSSPQRIQQIAQAAQAAVTSASSSISDITNSDLFSIGDNDTQQSRTSKTQSSVSSQQNTFQDVPLVLPLESSAETMEYTMTTQDTHDNQRQRRLSNSSFASDVSFRLPSYETPSMYHLQSDIEVSASEAEERGFSSGTVSLDRVTKEQLYAAYRRTQERYTKYRTQYGDLARHYKLLERENAKARSVLVETQDKALRRISELREQCSLEQSAKAHLEKALRVEIEEKNMKIETLDTKIKLLQDHSGDSNNDKSDNQYKPSEEEADVQLINFSNDVEIKQHNESTELLVLNNKLEKMEQLLNKYKDSLKTSKEKNSQLNTDLQLLANELENKNEELEKLQIITAKFTDAEHKIRELSNLNEELQNQVNMFQFNESKGQSTLEIDYQKALEEIKELRSKIEIFSKREEDYAISLAENKLSIHKELESKEAEIRSLKDGLEANKKELQSQSIVINDYKKNLASLEAERLKLVHNNTELTSSMTKIGDLESLIEELSKKNHCLEQSKLKVDEAYKFLELQMKQENAEKLAMVDRNSYLENRNTQLSEENNKKSSQISKLESEFQNREHLINTLEVEDSKEDELFEELSVWKDKYAKLEAEIQEERDELIKLQSEIEKLLANHELLQTQNIEYSQLLSELRAENAYLQEKLINNNKIKLSCFKLASDIKEVKTLTKLISNDAKSLKIINTQALASLVKQIHYALNNIPKSDTNSNIQTESQMENILLQQEIKSFNVKFESLSKELILLKDENNNLKSTINGLELEKSILDEEVKRITNHYEATITEMNSVQEKNEGFLHKIKEFENNFQNLQIALDFEKKQYMESVEALHILEKENKRLLGQIKDSENEIKSNSVELNIIKNQHKTTKEELDGVRRENEYLLNQAEILEKQIDHVKVLQEDNKNLTVENLSLKSQAQSITDRYNNLELEVTDIRKSHAEIVLEKNRLNDIIQKLEINLCKLTDDQFTQTDNEGDQEIIKTSLEQQSTVEKLKFYNTQKLVNLTETKPQQNLDTNIEFSNEYVTLKTEYDILKDENRRFKSDIEGLQTYLTKISKENSILNDKLRELIANSEHAMENTEVSNELLDLKKKVQLSKEKIDDLLRENTILVEENLELKDQIQTQNCHKNDDKRLLKSDIDDSVYYKEKLNNLLHVNNTLEKRLMDLEKMNKSVDGNAIQMRENNEKLRLTNEKLERRLDEALVSLRHLHSLQENTELEYLRNILYEYLTGPGMHSLTLAKVLSAIVKFDDMQTKLVLQKEKERQGFLRQLGII